MEYKDPGRYIPYYILGVPGLGFPVESLYRKQLVLGLRVQGGYYNPA